MKKLKNLSLDLVCGSCVQIPKWPPSCSLPSLWMDGLGPGAKAEVVQPAPPCPSCRAESKIAGEDSSPCLRRMQTSRLQPPFPRKASWCVFTPPAWSDHRSESLHCCPASFPPGASTASTCGTLKGGCWAPRPLPLFPKNESAGGFLSER